MKNRFKTYGFWMSLSSAIIILIQSVASLFGYEFQTTLIENIIMAVCGVLVVLGIVNKPAQTEPLQNEETTQDNSGASDEVKETFEENLMFKTTDVEMQTCLFNDKNEEQSTIPDMLETVENIAKSVVLNNELQVFKKEPEAISVVDNDNSKSETNLKQSAQNNCFENVSSNSDNDIMIAERVRVSDSDENFH